MKLTLGEIMKNSDALVGAEPVDEAVLLLLLDRVDATIASTQDELRGVRMAVLSNMSADARALAQATGQTLYRDLGRAELLRLEIGKCITNIRTQRAASVIAKNRGSHLAELRAEHGELRKCADSRAASALDEPTQRRLRQALIRVELEIAQASR